MAKRSLHIVLTCGNQRDAEGNLMPTSVAIMRLRRTVTDVLAQGGGDILLCGGYRKVFANNEAGVLARWAKSNCKELSEGEQAGRINLYTQAYSKYTAHDMVMLVHSGKPIGYDELIICSHPNHVEMAEWTLRDRGVETPIRCLDSGEPVPYGATALKILRWVYKRDKSWTKIWSWPLRVMANRRGLDE